MIDRAVAVIGALYPGRLLTRGSPYGKISTKRSKSRSRDLADSLAGLDDLLEITEH